MSRMVRLWHDCNVPATAEYHGWSCDGCGTAWLKRPDPYGAPPDRGRAVVWRRVTLPTRWVWPWTKVVAQGE